MADDIRLTLGSADLAREWFEPLCRLYDEIFAEPPLLWSEGQSDDHRKSLERLLASPGFALAMATEGDRLIGFAYGRTLPTDTHWWDGFLESVPAEVTTEYPGRTFSIIDFGVERGWRGHGLGRRLLDTLLADREEERASLAVEPEAENSQQFYRHLGWHLVGRLKGAPTDTAPFFDMYVLPLRDQASPAA